MKCEITGMLMRLLLGVAVWDDGPQSPAKISKRSAELMLKGDAAGSALWEDETAADDDDNDDDDDSSNGRHKRFNEFVGKRALSEDKRYEFLGKRNPYEFLGKRNPYEFLGKRNFYEFLGKRSPYEFLGKRSPYEFLGKRNPYEFLGKRNPYEFLGKRSPYEFLGKRNPYEFLGKRSPYEFLGKRSPYEFLGKRNPYEFLGKRSGPYEFLGKRSGPYEFIGKRALSSSGKDGKDSGSSSDTKSKRVMYDFYGKRVTLPYEFIGKRIHGSTWQRTSTNTVHNDAVVENDVSDMVSDDDDASEGSSSLLHAPRARANPSSPASSQGVAGGLQQKTKRYSEWLGKRSQSASPDQLLRDFVQKRISALVRNRLQNSSGNHEFIGRREEDGEDADAAGKNGFNKMKRYAEFVGK